MSDTTNAAPKEWPQDDLTLQQSIESVECAIKGAEERKRIYFTIDVRMEHARMILSALTAHATAERWASRSAEPTSENAADLARGARTKMVRGELCVGDFERDMPGYVSCPECGHVGQLAALAHPEARAAQTAEEPFLIRETDAPWQRDAIRSIRRVRAAPTAEHHEMCNMAVLCNCGALAAQDAE